MRGEIRDARQSDAGASGRPAVGFDSGKSFENARSIFHEYSGPLIVNRDRRLAADGMNPNGYNLSWGSVLQRVVEKVEQYPSNGVLFGQNPQPPFEPPPKGPRNEGGQG